MRRAIILGTALALAASCGGGEATFRIKYRFDDTSIAGIDPAQKREIIDAQSRIIVAQQEWQKAQHDVGELRHQVDLANSDLDVKNAQYRSASMELGVAKSSNDQNRIGNANKGMNSARLGRVSAQRKVAWMESQVSYLKEQQRFYKMQVDYESAGYEVAKAKVARDHNIRPPGFNFADYTNQQAEGARYLARYRNDVNKSKTNMLKLEGQYRTAQGAFDASTGMTPAAATGGPGMTPAGSVKTP